MKNYIANLVWNRWAVALCFGVLAAACVFMSAKPEVARAQLCFGIPMPTSLTCTDQGQYQNCAAPYTGSMWCGIGQQSCCQPYGCACQLTGWSCGNNCYTQSGGSTSCNTSTCVLSGGGGYCGDGNCNNGETCSTCANDCGSCGGWGGGGGACNAGLYVSSGASPIYPGQTANLTLKIPSPGVNNHYNLNMPCPANTSCGFYGVQGSTAVGNGGGSSCWLSPCYESWPLTIQTNSNVTPGTVSATVKVTTSWYNPPPDDTWYNNNCSDSVTVSFTVMGAGACGSANGSSSYTSPSGASLCSSPYGNSSVTDNGGSWTWTCNGSNGGSPSGTCTATKKIDGSCGSSNGTSSYSAPSTNLCAAGTATSVSGSGPWTWSCNGVNGGAGASCSANLKVDGICGSSNGSTFYSAPTTSLCAAGSSSSVSGSGPWSWACYGSNGGGNASCGASLKVDGACGAAAASYAYSASGYAGAYCNAGNPSSSPAFPAAGSSVTWTCTGINGGNSSGTCTASRGATPINGACGSSNGSSFYSAPSSNLCNSGSQTAVSGSGPWSWSCTGANGGSTASCSASLKVDGVCGGAAGSYAYNASGYNGAYCNAGNPNSTPAFPASGNSTTWTCLGINGGNNSAICTATRAATPVNGSCGSSNGSNFYSAPSANLCSTAYGNSAVSGSGPWSWTCYGANGGSNASCGANLSINGACGSSNGSNFYSAPSSGLCNAGSASSVSGSGPWSWSCAGTNGGSTASCSANLSINGACGSSNGSSFYSAPSTGLCNVGTASSVLGSGPWTWNCNGSNGGSTASCSANKSVNGACGTANKTYLYSDVSYGSDTYCSTGNPSSTPGFPAQGSSVTWTCNGVNGGTNSGTCTASRGNAPVNGICGSSNGSNFYSAPSSNLCAAGSTGSVTGSGPWSWVCSGLYGGGNASCSANLSVNGACGSSNGSNFYSAPSTNLCNSGNQTAISGSGPWTWSCSGINGGSTASCSANLSVNGACGSSNGSNIYSAPSTNLCGTAYGNSAVSGSGPWSWTCYGANGGSTASCSANLRIDGVCGSANGSSFYSAPSSNLCAAGSTGSVSGSGPWNWSCAGSNGGSTAFCSANKSVNGACGTANKTYLSSDTSYGSDTYCSAGNPTATPAFPAQGSSVTWSCSGINGGSGSGTCTASRGAAPVNGACGSSNGTGFYSAPTTNFCNSGTPTAVSGSGPWSWACAGLNGGSNDLCTAPLKVDGACGGAAGNYPYNASGYNGAYCNAGTANSTPAFPAAGNSTSWTCLGLNGGNNSAICTTTRAATPANGACGSSNGSNFYSAPSVNLCSTAYGNSAVSGSGPWSWTCYGANGGSNASCGANLSVNGACGSSNGSNFYSAPSANLCNAGSNSAVSGSGPWSWTCTGTNGGSTASCSANLIVDGVCGSAAGAYGSGATGYNGAYCNAGSPNATPAFPAAGNSTSWTCLGSNGGNNSAICVATRNASPVNGACGTANKTYLYSDSSYGSDTYCSAGNPTATPAFPTQGSSVTWSCSGINGGSNSGTCTASRNLAPVNGICGPSNGSNFYSAPSSNLCAAGSATGVSGSGPWTWSCNGLNGGSAASCSANKAVDGICGSSNGSSFYSAPSTNLCAAGTTNVVLGSGPWSWSCGGINGGSTASCSANRSIDGMCGTANKAYLSTDTSYGSDTYCNAGSPSATPVFPAQGTSVTWSCIGVYGGATSGTCTASRGNAPVNGTCGSASGSSFYSAPSSNLCNSGSVGTVSGAGPWAWSCYGANGGSTASCSASLKVDGACGGAAGSYAYNASGYNGAYCNAGTANSTPAFPASGSTATWTCLGTNGGNNSAICVATRSASPVNGACGTANKTYLYSDTSYGSDTYCSAGNPSATPAFPAQGSAVTWSCNGTNGGTNAGNCTASRGTAPVNGACGSSSGQNLASAPTSGLCNAGTASAVSGTGPWSWSCAGLNGGSTASCSATWTGSINGTCGPAAATYNSTTNGYAGAYCNTGTPNSTPFFPIAGASTSWTCLGLNGGTNAMCTATRLSGGCHRNIDCSDGDNCTVDLCFGVTSTDPADPGYYGTCSYSPDASCTSGPVCGNAGCNYFQPTTQFTGASRSDCGYSDTCHNRFAFRNGDGTWNCQEQYISDCDCPACSNNTVYCGSDNICHYTPVMPPPPPPTPPSAPASVTTNSSACGQITVSWSASSGASYYYLYRSTTSTRPAAPYQYNLYSTNYTDTSVAGGTFYYYWVTAVGPGGESGATADTAAPRIANSCAANLSDSDKDISGVNTYTFTNPVRGSCNGFQAVPSDVTFKTGDIVHFTINICNDTGLGDATSVTVTDRLTNLQQPSGGWNAKLDGVAITPASVTGSAPYFGSTLTFAIGTVKSPPASPNIRTLTFDAQIAAPSNYGSSYSRFQNNATIDYIKDGANWASPAAQVSTPLLIFSTQAVYPGRVEVSP